MSRSRRRNDFSSSKLRSGVNGLVIKYDARSRCGVITPQCTNTLVFFDQFEVLYKPVEVGDEVKFDLYAGPMGHYAKSVKLLVAEMRLEAYAMRQTHCLADNTREVSLHASAIQCDVVKVGNTLEIDVNKGPEGTFENSLRLLNQTEHGCHLKPISYSKSTRETSGVRRKKDGAHSKSRSSLKSKSETSDVKGKLMQSDVTGVVTQYFPKREHGFILEDNSDTLRKVYFHSSAVLANAVHVGDKVKFNLHLGPKGHSAESVEILNQGADHSHDSDCDQDKGAKR